MHQDFAGLRKRGAVIVVQCEAGSPLRPKRAALRAAQGFAPSLPRTGNLKHPWGILIVADEKERLTPNSARPLAVQSVCTALPATISTQKEASMRRASKTLDGRMLRYTCQKPTTHRHAASGPTKPPAKRRCDDACVTVASIPLGKSAPDPKCP